ncbi:hypothetical protein NKH77_26080 [Streptomyces sp. M19]
MNVTHGGRKLNIDRNKVDAPWRSSSERPRACVPSGTTLITPVHPPLQEVVPTPCTT